MIPAATQLVEDFVVLLRPSTDNDVPFIHSSFMRSYALRGKESHGFDFLQTYQSAVLEPLIARAGVTVACWEEDPDVIFGWASFEPSAVHYCYVKQAFRNNGIARRLLGAYKDRQDVYYTHRLPHGMRAPSGWLFTRSPINERVT